MFAASNTYMSSVLPFGKCHLNTNVRNGLRKTFLFSYQNMPANAFKKTFVHSLFVLRISMINNVLFQGEICKELNKNRLLSFDRPKPHAACCEQVYLCSMYKLFYVSDWSIFFYTERNVVRSLCTNGGITKWVQTPTVLQKCSVATALDFATIASISSVFIFTYQQIP